MPDRRRSRYEENGESFNGYASSAPHKSNRRGGDGFNDHSESRTQHGPQDYEPSRSREMHGSREYESSRSRERDWEKGRDHERHHKDQHKDRSDRSERGKSRDNDDDFHCRDNERDRAGQHMHRSRSRSGGRSPPPRSRSHSYRSKSPSRSQSKSKRISGFDMAPSASAAGGQTLGQNQAFQQCIQSCLVTAAQTFSTFPVIPVVALSQQATQHARRVYVGGLSPTATEESVATFFSRVMSAIGGNTAGPGNAVVTVYINHDKKFAFVEMRSVEEASNAMALDGIIYEGASVKVKRPTNYNPSLAAALGPSEPNPNLNLAAVDLTSGSAARLEGPDRLFVGGIPYYFTEVEIREVLESFGPLRGFDLVKDRETGNSKGYAFCVYQDLSVTDLACDHLNGIKIGDKTLTVRRATQGASYPKPEQETVLLQVQQQILFQKRLYQGEPSAVPTRVVSLTQAVNTDELKDDEEYQYIMEDMREEGGKYGNLVNAVIPRPGPNGEESTPGVGKVFLEYADTDGAFKAQAGMNGRKFGGNQVVAIYYPENMFSQGVYDA